MNSNRTLPTLSPALRLTLVVLTLGALLLGSCRGKSTPTATVASPPNGTPASADATEQNPGEGGDQPAATEAPYPGPQGGAPNVTEEVPYPGPQGGAPIVTEDMPYPGPQGGAPVITDESPYPGPGGQAPVAAATATAPATANVPAAATTVAPTTASSPAPTATAPSAYPGPAVVPTFNPYPGPGNQPTPFPTYNPYPGPGGAATATLPAGLPTNTPGITGGSATPTFSFQTSTPTFQSTPFTFTTPTPTPAPTPSPTPIPPTLDLAARLRATNPRSVKLASGKVQLIEFFAFWDGASKSMAPMMSSLETQYGEQVNFIYLDIDDPKTAAFKKTLYYRSQPEFILVDGQGKILKRWSGYVKRNELEKALLAVQ